MRRLLRILTGFVVAMLAAAATHVRFAMPHAPSFSSAREVLVSWWSDFGILTLAAATHITIFSFIFAFLAIILGEWLARREWTYYVVAGVLIGLGGCAAQFVSENASQPTIVNNYALIAFVTTGAVGGLVYWVIAGHRAGRIVREPLIRVAEPAAQVAPSKEPTVPLAGGGGAAAASTSGSAAREAAAAAVKLAEMQPKVQAAAVPKPEAVKEAAEPKPKAPKSTAEPKSAAVEAKPADTAAAEPKPQPPIAQSKPAASEPPVEPRKPMTSVPVTVPALPPPRRLQVAERPEPKAESDEPTKT